MGGKPCLGVGDGLLVGKGVFVGLVSCIPREWSMTGRRVGRFGRMDGLWTIAFGGGGLIRVFVASCSRIPTGAVAPTDLAVNIRRYLGLVEKGKPKPCLKGQSQ